MKSYLIETSVIVNFLRGKTQTVKEVEDLEGELASSLVCLAELYEGIYLVRRQEKAEKAVLNFFSGLSEIYGLDEEVAQNFGRIRAGLKRKGRVIEDLDILVAATCLAHNLILVTSNPKHFQRIDGLEILGLGK